MGGVLVRLLFLVAGFGLLEESLPPALVAGGLDWLGVTAGLVLVLAGSAGFMVPLFESKAKGGSRG